MKHQKNRMFYSSYHHYARDPGCILTYVQILICVRSSAQYPSVKIRESICILIFLSTIDYRRPRTPLIRPSVCHKICHKINRRGQITGWRKQEAEGRMLCQPLPAGLVGFSADRRLQKLSSAPRALARLQYVEITDTENH